MKKEYISPRMEIRFTYGTPVFCTASKEWSDGSNPDAGGLTGGDTVFDPDLND